ncbi:methyltransferase domain-containing protein [Agarilytica rhodophyticola]|uniref:methyltransferase domain-containing protein n=1 Tax=Agarilytica rhodophyticola TaxID=1737490 RepID=UPI000B343141|nr:methyltransferase domain-containing protein [Agarilytica rhodophyticola]
MLDEVKNYYGNTLQSSDDLLTNACCTGAEPPEYLKGVLSGIHDEVMAKYYGCGLVIPQQLEGTKVLDLGCGAGRDVYALSRLVGEQGRVVGVDMTDEQLNVAKSHQSYHAEKYGYQKSNVEFVKGELENLASLGLEKNSFDIIVSNCVINLCVDKTAVLQAAYDLLKPGGEIYFSDVYASRRVPENLKSDPVLYGECLSGAFYWNDFINTAKTVGFRDPRLVEDSPIIVERRDLAEKLEGIEFYSATYRLFKLESLEPYCEDYGQAVIYKGSISHHPHFFKLDNSHIIESGKVFPVCGNTESMLRETRFAEHFEFIGDRSRHYGIFEGCGTAIPFNKDEVTQASDNSTGCC